MALLTLGEEWSHRLDLYRADHQHPVNEACHTVGVPLVASSVLLGMTLVGLPLAAPLFVAGWTFQLLGHAFEAKRPSFLSDPRQLATGLLWWTQKVGLPLADLAPTATPPAD
jgi:uncharacterized membrane protein YGL010W